MVEILARRGLLLGLLATPLILRHPSVGRIVPISPKDVADGPIHLPYGMRWNAYMEMEDIDKDSIRWRVFKDDGTLVGMTRVPWHALPVIRDAL